MAAELFDLKALHQLVFVRLADLPHIVDGVAHQGSFHHFFIKVLVAGKDLGRRELRKSRMDVADAVIKVQSEYSKSGGVPVGLDLVSGDTLSPEAEGIWDKGVFIKELEVALEAGEIDVAVHSLKDLPTVLEDPFQLRSVLERAPVADAWIGKIPWSEVEKGSRVGTSSVRRERQVKFLKPGAKVVDIRGNVPTRIKKAALDADYDGIILAEAGLNRLGYPTEGMFEIERHPLFVECLAEKNFFPAAGQGAVGL